MWGAKEGIPWRMLKPRSDMHSDARCSSGGGGGGAAVDEAEQAEGGGILFRHVIEEQILGHPEGAMDTNNGGAEGERGEDDSPDGGQKHDERRGRDEPAQRLAIGERPAEGGEGRGGGRVAEEVEEAPGGEERQEGEERERVGEEGDGEGEGDEGEVVDAEVGEVLPEAGGGGGDGVRAGEGGPVEELRPGAGRGEGGFGRVVEAEEEGPRRGWVWGGGDGGWDRAGRRSCGGGDGGREGRGGGGGHGGGIWISGPGGGIWDLNWGRG